MPEYKEVCSREVLTGREGKRTGSPQGKGMLSRGSKLTVKGGLVFLAPLRVWYLY